MANVLVGRRAVAARQLRTGEAAGFTLHTGQLMQIVDLVGQQIATFLAFRHDEATERLSTTATITADASIVLTRGGTLRSNRGNPMLTLVEDSVGRHDLLTAAPGPDPDIRTANGTGSCLDALMAVAAEHDIAADELPDPVHLFKNVIIKQRGEIEEREPLSERNDSAVLRAEMDLLVIIVNCPARPRGRQLARTGRPGELLVRVYGEP
ncbi:MAG: urea carboxylase-associated family protein [Chloroflexota bacterium]|nr:urea carboxylase-associated family protein [Chloroflexota bacterium]